jgi:hypothetical protein
MSQLNSSMADESENGEDNVELRDHAQRKAPASAKLAKTSTNHFDKYLIYLRTNSLGESETLSAWRTIHDLPPEPAVLRDHLGKFSDFLFRKVTGVTKWKTHSNYLIPVFDTMLSKLVLVPEGLRQQFIKNYSNLRSQTESLYKENAQRQGLPFVQHAVVASVKVFDWIYWTLYTWGLYSVLVSIVFDFTSMGRVIEKIVVSGMVLQCLSKKALVPVHL